MAPVQTAESRRRFFDTLASDFSKHLTTVPGVFLPSNIRLGIAICAREALFCSKKGCNDVFTPRSAPFVGASDHGPGHEGNEEESRAFPSQCCASLGAIDVLTSTIHAIVRHQDQLDDEWYVNTIEAIRTCGLVPSHVMESNDEDGIDLACRSIFCEILNLTATSHGLHILFLALGCDEPPPLPSFSDVKNAALPTNIHFPSLLRRVRRDESIAAAPYFLWSDIKTDSPEFMKLAPQTRRNLFWYDSDYLTPYVAAFFAPDDAMIMIHILSSLYTGRFPRNFLKMDLDPKYHCPSVTRNIAVYFAPPGVVGINETVLRAFVRAVTSLPYDAESVQVARNDVVAQGGRELEVEACAIIGAFELVTKVADGTIRKPWLSRHALIMKLVMYGIGMWKVIIVSFFSIMVAVFLMMRTRMADDGLA